MENVRRKFLETASKEQLWAAEETIVVALSGGPDSMALLHLLWTDVQQGAERTLIAAHANHGFRVEESASEAEQVEDYCRKLGIICETEQLDVPSFIAETGMNAQAAARKLRYDFLHRTAARYGAGRIALGHHADDQAETVLMRILRGTGTSGLAGIPVRRREKNVELIRPLLRITKTELLMYCEAFQLPYCIDSSNEQRYYFRNVVRLDILPYLQQFSPQLSPALTKLADLASEEDDWLQQQTDDLFREHVRVVAKGCKISRGTLLQCHVALQRRLIKLILNYLSLEKDSASFDIVELARGAALLDTQTTGRLDLGQGIVYIREYDELWFIRSQELSQDQAVSFCYELTPETEQLYIVEANTFVKQSTATLLPADEWKGRERYEIWLDAAQLIWPLRFRNRKPGDRMAVRGLNGTKKVQDMFVDEKVPQSQRDRIPILCDGQDQLLWIPGLRRSAIALPTERSSELMRLQAFFHNREDEGDNPS